MNENYDLLRVQQEKKNKLTTLFISVVVIVVGFLNGGFKAIDEYDNGGCKYQSIASYNPSRIIICELLRKRWD